MVRKHINVEFEYLQEFFIEYIFIINQIYHYRFFVF